MTNLVVIVGLLVSLAVGCMSLAKTFTVTVPTIQGAATCDDQMKFSADGVQLAANDDWTVSSPISLPASTKVIGIYCYDAGGVGGTLASFDNGVVTDSSWRCINAAKEPHGWNKAGFDDSQWGQATEISNNGPNSYPHHDKIVAGISTSAKWIWTPRWRAEDRNVYCRKELGYDCGDNNPCGPPVINAGQNYYPSDNSAKFVQCSPGGQCDVMSCEPGLVWDPVAYTCNWP